MENFGICGSVADDNWIRVCNFSRDTLNNSGGSLRQEQVWVCEACHSALAAFFCKADAASLCTNCDAEIHSANSLASRHRRVPIFAAPAARPAAEFSGVDIESTVTGSQLVDDFAEEDEAASWLLFNPIKMHAKIENSVPLYNPEEANDYLGSMDFQLFNEKYDQQHHHEFDVPRPKSLESDGLVPVHTTTRGNSLQLGLNYEPSTKGYKSNYPLSQSTVSASPTDVGIVPDSGMCTASISDLGTPRETIDLVSGRDRLIPTPAQFNSADREARVLRYREKKKARKFEKTIRYASRKAYAEIRPRIKGRFVKRSVVEIENDTSSALHPDNGYGIVPSL